MAARACLRGPAEARRRGRGRARGAAPSSPARLGGTVSRRIEGSAGPLRTPGPGSASDRTPAARARKRLPGAPRPGRDAGRARDTPPRTTIPTRSLRRIMRGPRSRVPPMLRALRMALLLAALSAAHCGGIKTVSRDGYRALAAFSTGQRYQIAVRGEKRRVEGSFDGSPLVKILRPDLAKIWQYR